MPTPVTTSLVSSTEKILSTSSPAFFFFRPPSYGEGMISLLIPFALSKRWMRKATPPPVTSITAPSVCSERITGFPKMLKTSSTVIPTLTSATLLSHRSTSRLLYVSIAFNTHALIHISANPVSTNIIITLSLMRDTFNCLFSAMGKTFYSVAISWAAHVRDCSVPRPCYKAD